MLLLNLVLRDRRCSIRREAWVLSNTEKRNLGSRCWIRWCQLAGVESRSPRSVGVEVGSIRRSSLINRAGRGVAGSKPILRDVVAAVGHSPLKSRTLVGVR